MTEISTEVPDNVVGIAGRDPTNAERQRRYRERRRNGNAKVGRNAKRSGRNGNGRNGRRQRVDAVSKSAVRYAAQAAGRAAELIEFPTSRCLAEVTEEPVTENPTAPNDPRPSLPAHSGRIADLLAYGVACGLAGIAAWFSLRGLAVLFPGAPHEIIVMGAIMECAKLVACGWLAGAWRHVPWGIDRCRCR